jgi:hypothetical protein
LDNKYPTKGLFLNFIKKLTQEDFE